MKNVLFFVHGIDRHVAPASGTGKTMAAALAASAPGLDQHCFDLAALVSK